MYRSRMFLNLKSRKHIYHSLVYSHLSYSNIIWGSANKTKLSNLESKHKHVCKVMIFKKRKDSARQAMKNLGLLSVKSINVLQTLSFMFKHSKGLIPIAFKDMFPKKITKYNLRSTKKGDITLPKNTCKYIENSLSYRGPKQWNTLSEELKSLLNQSAFKKALKNNLIREQ